jgi:type IX secretion system PorP/SprF family membrane protein
LYYAQKIKLAKDHHLALGVSFGLLNTHIDFANAIATDVNDPNILNATKSGIGFDMNVGIAYQWKKLTIGFAVPHIVNTNVTLSDQTKSSNYDAIRNYVANVSYEFSFKKETWNLEPSILFRKGTGSIYQIEGNLMANYKRIVFLGIGYRQDYGMTAQAAVRISRCVTLGYSYEYPIIGGVTYGNTKGTHEVLVGINFDRWIKNNELKKLKNIWTLYLQIRRTPCSRPKKTKTALYLSVINSFSRMR